MAADASLGVSSAPGRGIALVLVSGAVFTANDTIIKWLRADYPVGELVSVRGVFTLVAMLVMLRFMGGWRTLRIHDWRAQWLRSGLVLITTVCFVGALRYMPLADAIGIAFAGPMFSVALAAPLLGERVGWRRWTAVGIGFAGVVLMVNPTGHGFQLAAILPLVTALGGALRDIVTRRMSVTDHSNATLGFSVLVATTLGTLTLPLGIALPSQSWLWPTYSHLGLFAVSGLLMGVGQYCIIESLRVAQVGLVAPFKYVSYVWAILLGFTLFGDLPSGSSVVGAIAVIGSGMFIAWRERRLALERRAKIAV
jgi:drug/metabolite transporter (DMT)-like permease